MVAASGWILCGGGCRQERAVPIERTETIPLPGPAPLSPADAVISDERTPTEEQKQKMLAARDALFQQLSGKLMGALGSGGPAEAISVCREAAPAIATQISTQHDLAIGRTGVRLRNPHNTGPHWTSELIQTKTDTPQFVTLTSGHDAALLPIKLQSQCLMCHGNKAEIPSSVHEQLAGVYPDDQATGFAEGELRGWFWIELPPR